MSISMKRKFAPLVLGVLGAVSLSLSSPAHAGLNLISESQEKQIGAQAAQQMEAQYGVSSNRSMNNLVQQMGMAMARRSSRPNLPWSFKVLRQQSLNAVSLPGGYIYVHEGLIDALAGDRDMLAGVIGHEVAHVAKKHHVKMMEKQTAGNLLTSLLFKGKTRNYVSLFANVYALKWSRSDEYESDREGVKYAAMAGYDPAGLPRFLQVLESKYGGGSKSGPASWMASHPATSERIKRAYAVAETMEGSSSTTRTRTRRSTRRSNAYRDPDTYR